MSGIPEWAMKAAVAHREYVESLDDVIIENLPHPCDDDGILAILLAKTRADALREAWRVLPIEGNIVGQVATTIHGAKSAILSLIEKAPS